MRFIGISLTLLILVIVGAVIAPQFIDWNQYKGKIINQAELASGYDLDISGDLDLAVLPLPHVIVNGLSVTNPAEKEAFVTLDRAAVYLDILPLLSGKISLKSITLTNPNIALRLLQNGQQNWMTQTLSSTGTSQTDDIQTNAKSANSPAITIGSLRIENGTLSYKDMNTKDAAQEVSNLNATFSMGSLQGPFDINAAMLAMGQDIKIDAKTETLDEKSQSISANITIDTKDAAVTFSGVMGYGADMDAQGETKITLKNSEMPATLSGMLSATLSKASLTDLTFKTADLELSGGASATGFDQYPKKDIEISFDLKGAQPKSVSGILHLRGGDQMGLKIARLNVGDYAGMSATLKGQIADIIAVSGLDLYADVQTPDLEASLTSLKQEAVLTQLPAKIGAVSTSSHVTGSLQNLKFDITASALNGSASAAGSLKNAGQKTQILEDMSFGLKHPNLAKLMIALMPDSPENSALAQAVDVAAKINMRGTAVDLKDIKGSFGPVNLSGALSADMGSKIPVLRGEITAGKLPLALFMAPSAKVNKAAPATTLSSNAAGIWPTDPIDTAWLNTADIDMKISAAQLTYEKWVFDKPTFGLVMKDGTLEIKDLNAGLFGGKSQVNMTLRGGHNPLGIEADLSVQDAGLQSLVSAMAGAPILQSQGTANFKTSLKASGGSMAALISALNGDGTISGDDITIRGVDVANISRAMTSTDNLGDQAKALFKSGIRGGSSEFDTLAGAFDVKDGIVTFSELDLQGSEAGIKTTGDISLPQWSIDMKSVIQVTSPADAPPFDVTYRGSLSNPGSSFAEEAIQGYLSKKISSKVNKLIEKKLGSKLDGKLGGALGDILGTQQQPSTDNGDAANDNQPAPTNNPTDDAVQGLIKGLLQ